MTPSVSPSCAACSARRASRNCHGLWRRNRRCRASSANSPSTIGSSPRSPALPRSSSECSKWPPSIKPRPTRATTRCGRRGDLSAMDKETIRQIAAEVVARLPDTGHRWYWFLGLQTFLMILGAGVAAYFGSYLRTRGQNLATQHDFDKLQAQLKETTVAVETIKSEVSQRDWA